MESFPIQDHCSTCRAPCCGNFKRILTLMDSRLNIYKPLTNRWQADDRIILHNTGNRLISKSEFMKELDQYKDLCPLCKLFIKKTRNLVSNVIIMNVNEIRVICNHCKLFKTLKQCKRCDEIITRYILEHSIYDKPDAKTLTEVRCIIGKGGKQMENKSDSLEELLKLIRVKRESSKLRDMKYPKILDKKVLKDIDIKKDSVISKEDISKKLEIFQSGDNTDIEKSCICRKVAKTLQKKLSPYSVMKNQISPPINDTPKEILMKTDSSINALNKKLKTSSSITVRKTNKSENKIFKETHKDTKPKEASVEVNEKESSDIFMKMIMERHKNRKRDEVFNIKRFEKRDFGELPQLPVKDETSLESVHEESENTVVCESLKAIQPKEMIKGNKIVQHDHETTGLKHFTLKPLLFEITHNFSGKIESSISSDLITSSNDKGDIQDQIKEFTKAKETYQLSNADYIQNGWTVLPEHKIMRQLNIYKMIPANSTFDWFSSRKQIYYKTGELLADVNDGQGRWYYKDGQLALDFFETTERNSNKMYCVYDVVGGVRGCGNKNKLRRDTSLLLACFDFKGNGTVYDRLGKTRLKYNQSEGVILDPQIGPPSRWKWHTLNDPPILVGVYHEKYLKPHDECLDKLSSCVKITSNNVSDEMIEIELKNKVRETLKKMSLELKPIEIKSKVFKLNDYFSLKILSQSKIHLVFRDTEKCLKVNVGMKLQCHEIVGVETVDVTEVVKDIDVRRFNRH